MKLINSIIILILFLSINKNVYAQISDSDVYRSIYTPIIFLDTNAIYILNDSIEFDGYLIYKFWKNDSIYPMKGGKSTIAIESYFISDLKFINNFENRYYYISENEFYDIYVNQGRMDEMPLEMNPFTLRILNFIKTKLFIDFKNLYLKYYPDNEDNINCFMYDNLTTKIFSDSAVTFLNRKNCDTIGYYIFKCSFPTAILRFSAFLDIENKRTGQKNLNTINVLLPIGPVNYFVPIKENEYIINRFNKSKWLPDIFR